MKKDYSGYFTTFDVCRILKLKRDRLKDWIDQEFVIPTIREDIALGKKSYFDRWGLYMIKLFHHVITNGISRKQAAEWIKELSEFKNQQNKLDPMKADFLIIKRKESRVVDRLITFGPSNILLKPDEDIDDAYIIKFSKIRKSVDTAIDL